MCKCRIILLQLADRCADFFVASAKSVQCIPLCFLSTNEYKMLSYRRDRAAGCVIVFAKKWQKVEDRNWKTIFYGH